MANPSINTNPWKGLNYYKEGEVLYGRNSEIESLSQYILNNTQTVLYGKSGIGKSSILNAGIFPIARSKGLLPVPIRLDHSKGNSYIEQIRTAIVESGADVHEILPPIDPEKETLWEHLHRNIFFDKDGKRVQLLLVLDQFEEIFTLQQDERVKRAFFDEIADVINDITPLYIVKANKKESVDNVGIQEVTESLDDLDIDFELEEASASNQENRYLQKIDHHMVFTLREDFLSYLERYSSYIPAMKSNRFALLPINEEQAVDIIMKPVEGLIDKDVAELIIQKVTGKTGFLIDDVPEIEVDSAVLSLYLSRIFIKKGDKNKITADIVNQFSEDIIKDFYVESVEGLPQNEIEKIEDLLLTYDGRRNNVSRNDLIREGVSRDVIKTLVEDKKLLRQFSYQDDIRVEFMHDILCPIVDERIDKREIAKQQAEEQRIQEEKQKRLLEEEQRKREAIEAKAEAEHKRMEEEALLQRRKNRVRLTAAISLLLLVLLTWFTWYFLTKMEFRESYATFTSEDGWPVGVGKSVKSADRDQMPVFYQLVRNGYYNRNTRVNVVNGDWNLVQNVFEQSPLVGLDETDGADEYAAIFAQMQRQTAYWIYTPDSEGKVSRITAFDINEEELYSMQFFRSGQTIWANYIDKYGQALRVRDNGADRIKISTEDINGHQYYSKFLFFNATNVPETNKEGDYGYQYDLDQNGQIVATYPLDLFGDPIPEKKTIFESYDAYGRWIKSSKGQMHYSNRAVIASYDNRNDTIRFDGQGHLMQATPLMDNGFIEILTYSANDSLPYRIERREVGDHQYTVSYFASKTDSPDASRQPIIITKTDWPPFHKMVVDTTSENGLTKVITRYYDGNGALVKDNDYQYNSEIAYYNSNNENVKSLWYKDNDIVYAYIYEYEDGRMVAQSVMGLDGQPIRCPDWEASGLSYYKMRLVSDTYDELVAIRGINEFGDESLISLEYGNTVYKYDITSAPSADTSLSITNGTLHARLTYVESLKQIKTLNTVDYIHILDLEGTWYKAGVRDGDLLVSQGPPLKVARPNPEKDTYDLLEFNVGNNKENGAIPYKVFFTEKEIDRYNKATQP